MDSALSSIQSPKLRDELLNGEIFYTLKEAQSLVQGWRREYKLTLPRFPGHLVKIHCRSRISGCGSCWQRGALSKRRWKSGVDFHGRVSFHS